jgi:ubiquinone/menaquinone biosynthesis C-methylase UbiE
VTLGVRREEGSAALWSAVADAADIEAGTVVLDVGCGTGGFCALAAARGAAVHGLDVAPAAIDQARDRVPDAVFRVGRMEDLPWPDGSFDVVTGFNSFQYALDIDCALGEARRVSRAGGQIAVGKWARPDENEFFAFLISLGAGSSRALRAADPVDAALRRARLAIRRSGEVTVALELDDAPALEAALTSAGALSAPVGRRERQTVRDRAAPFRQPDGSYQFRSRLSYVVAQT